MLKFRKKPVIISAIQWDGNNVDEIKELEKDSPRKIDLYMDEYSNTCDCTRENNHYCEKTSGSIHEYIHCQKEQCPDCFG
jgi:hypothetical protein